MAPHFAVEEVKQIFQIVLENGQIYAAGGTQEILMDFVNELAKRPEIDMRSIIDWESFIVKLKGLYNHYNELSNHLEVLEFIAEKD